MDEIKQKLEEYRLRKRKEQMENSPIAQNEITNIHVSNFNSTPVSAVGDQTLENDVSTSSINETKQPFSQKLSNFLLQLLIWLVLYAVALYLQFGIVYIIASGFYVLWKSLASKRVRADGELSAYSVFNPNCERLLGTLTAEQFENEIRHGPTPT